MKKKSTHYILSLIVATIVFFLLNTVINLVIVTVKGVLQADSIFSYDDLNYSFSNTIWSFSNIPFIVYMLVVLISLIAGGVILFKLRHNYRELEQSGLKGTSRFTTLKELRKQYKSVPEKGEYYEGSGGVPISRYNDKYFIDDSPVNNLWIGTTRSGKGEMGMFPMVDIYSRAKEPSSMVINDPKGELFAASKETLESRGYHVEVLNLDDPLKSMSYQILQIVIDAYEEGDLAKAEQYTKTITNMLYADPSAKDKMWQNTAMSLCNALILGLCEKNLPNHKEKVTMYTVAHTLNSLASYSYQDDEGNQKTGLDDFFDSLPKNHPAKLQYSAVKFAAGAGQTLAGILTNTFNGLSIFTLTPIAKMTSENSFDMRKIGFGKVISGITKAHARVNARFFTGTETVQADEKGLFTIYHNEDLQVGDRVTLDVKEKDERIQAVFDVQMINRETGEVTCQKMTGTGINSDQISLQKFEHFTKPTALFMVVPDYDKSLHVIASLYVKQLYTELSRTASNTRGEKCIREVVFILDEFGNMPVIDDMGTMITVCLGRNMRFNLVIQSYSQLEQNYEKDWKTIDGNCANTIYILTTNEDTAEEISKKLGDKTVTSTSRSGSTVSIDKSKTEGVEGRRLLTANELLQMQEGEMVVIRGIKRQDKKRKRITPYPIFNTGGTRMKYRFEYLSEWFDTDKSINDFDIASNHANTNLDDLVYDFLDKADAEEQDAQEEQPEELQEGMVGYEWEDENAISILADQTKLTTNEIKKIRMDDFAMQLDQWLKDGQISSQIHKVVKERIPKSEDTSDDKEQDAQEEQPEEQQQDDGKQEEPQDEQPYTVGTLFGNDRMLTLIEQNVVPHLSVEDVSSMSIDDFKQELCTLKDNGTIPDNLYNNIVRRIDTLLATTEKVAQ